MPTLVQAELLEACRSIYDMVAGCYVLPPLIRDAQDENARSCNVYNVRAGERKLCFSVSLDEAYADRNALPDSRLPVKFSIELLDERGVAGQQLPDADKHELLRAFFLGARAPISAEQFNANSEYRLSIQLAAKYSISCGQLSAACDNRISQDICNSVAEEIYECSRDFFADRQSGIAVWSARAAQDLFGEARPAAEAIWPMIQAQPVQTPLQVVALGTPKAAQITKAAQGTRTSRWRYAVAASLLIALMGHAFLDASFANSSDRSAAADLPEWRSVSIEQTAAANEVFAVQTASLQGPADGQISDAALALVFASAPTLPVVERGGYAYEFATFVPQDSATHLAKSDMNQTFRPKTPVSVKVGPAASKPLVKSTATAMIATNRAKVPTPLARPHPVSAPFSQRAAVAVNDVIKGLGKFRIRIASLLTPAPTRD